MSAVQSSDDRKLLEGWPWELAYRQREDFEGGLQPFERTLVVKNQQPRFVVWKKLRSQDLLLWSATESYH